MYQLYDLGYNEIRSVDLLAATAEILGAIVLDIRFSPRSRDPNWRMPALMNRLQESYTHVAALGNRNYKSGPIQIVDLDAGLRAVETVLPNPAVKPPASAVGI